ncbi:hypothetical protein [Nostoc sp.]|uniref:hypothetical protein n=1 Tax=Nostoc sp. TaxID=1180 RepID=UPI002FF9551F
MKKNSEAKPETLRLAHWCQLKLKPSSNLVSSRRLEMLLLATEAEPLGWHSQSETGNEKREKSYHLSSI